MKILTFIIPSYNVERYLTTTLKSYLNPQILDKIEVLIVNDGSTDGTKKVANRFVTAYPETFKLINKNNGGHGSAINKGSREARGKYLKVIDADDWVVTENLIELIEILENSSADVFLTPYHTIDIKTGEKKAYEMNCHNYHRTYDLKEIVEHWANYDKCLLFHGIGYRTKFYQEQNIQLTEGVFYEDHEYSTLPCSEASSIQPIDLFLYEYAIGNATQSVADINKLKHISDIEKVALKLSTYGTQVKNKYAYEYVCKKTAIMILSYYAVANIINPKKWQGYRMCKHFNGKLISIDKNLYLKVRRKYGILTLLGFLHFNSKIFGSVINIKKYKFNHRFIS